MKLALDVANRTPANFKSSAAIPQPSSSIWIKSYIWFLTNHHLSVILLADIICENHPNPPFLVFILIDFDLASIEFSINSFIALEGLSQGQCSRYFQTFQVFTDRKG